MLLNDRMSEKISNIITTEIKRKNKVFKNIYKNISSIYSKMTMHTSIEEDGFFKYINNQPHTSHMGECYYIQSSLDEIFFKLVKQNDFIRIINIMKNVY